MAANSSQQNGQTVGARVRAARLAKKYTQSELARPDFSVSYISAIERGQIQPSLRALEILAQRLELNTTDLLPARAILTSAPTSSGGSGTVGNDELELLLLEAQIAIHQRKPEQAITLLRGFLPQKGERRQEKATSLYYVLGQAFLLAGHLQESEQLLAQAIRQARDTSDPLYLCILSLQSAVYLATRNTEQAEQLQRECLSVLEKQSASNTFFLAQLHFALAQHYTGTGNYVAAIKQFQQTLQILKTRSSCQQLQQQYWQLFNIYQEQEHIALAALYSAKGQQATLRCERSASKSEIAYKLGRVLLQSNSEAAHAYLQQTSQEAAARHDGLTLAGANVQLASWLMARGEIAQAEQLVYLAQEQAAPFGETQVNADSLLLAGELAYRRRDYSVGDSCFEDGLALLEKVGTKEDFVQQLARYAHLLEERNCIQKAFFYLKRAYENRQESRMQAF